MKVSLNLGGGAGRGFAHVGVVRLLEEERIPFDMIIGVSVGALFGSVYAIKPDWQNLKKISIEFINSPGLKKTLIGDFADMMNDQKIKSIAKKLQEMYKKSSLLGKIFLTPGLLTKAEIDNMLFPFIPDIDIRDTKIPLSCVAVNVKTGQRVIFEKGSLRETIIASGSLPLVFPPRIISGVSYFDGGVLDKVGIDSAYELGMNHVIAVDVSNKSLEDSLVKNSFDSLLRAEEIGSIYRSKYQLKKATILIKPITGNIHWADYSQCDVLMDAGYEAARSHLGEIRGKLRLVSPFKRMFSSFHNPIEKKKKYKL